MTNEEMEEKMQFIRDQQAKFDLGMQKMREDRDKAEARMKPYYEALEARSALDVEWPVFSIEREDPKAEASLARLRDSQAAVKRNLERLTHLVDRKLAKDHSIDDVKLD